MISAWELKGVGKFVSYVGAPVMTLKLAYL